MMNVLFNRSQVVSMLALGLVLTACGAEPTYVTSHGISVVCEDLTKCLDQTQVETITEIFIGFVPDSDALRQAFKDSTIIMYVAPTRYIECNNGVTCPGLYQRGTHKIELGYSPCGNAWAIGNELAHYYQETVEDKFDSSHSDPTFYSSACQGSDDVALCADQTVIVRTFVTAAKAICVE